MMRMSALTWENLMELRGFEPLTLSILGLRSAGAALGCSARRSPDR